jgi:fucose 4-O-acetylase-like acetyltransferase
MSGESATIVNAMAAVDARARHAWLDALKGIGIIAVVAGHVWTRGVFRDAIYSFHMPLFFMASGAFARAVPMGILAPRLARALLLPFLSFSLLLLALDFLIEDLRGVRPIFPHMWAGISTILFSTETLRGPFAILWFVPCLFIARLIWNWLLINLGAARGRAMLLAMGVAMLAAVLVDDLGGRSPVGLLPVPAALLMIWAGALWKDWHPRMLVATATTLFAFAMLFWWPPLDLRSGDIGGWLIGLAGAVAIVDQLARLTRRLPPRIMNILGWIGRNSLVIMFMHIAFVHYLAPYAPKPLLFIAGLAGSLLISWLARKSRISRLFLLGERSPPPARGGVD